MNKTKKATKEDLQRLYSVLLDALIKRLESPKDTPASIMEITRKLLADNDVRLDTNGTTVNSLSDLKGLPFAKSTIDILDDANEKV